MKIRGPRGDRYTVRRRWLPWRRKVDFADAPVDLGGADDLGCLAFLAVIIAIPFILIAVVALAELLLLLLLLPLWLLVRILLRRPWTIEVRRNRALVHTDKVVGLRDSRLRMRYLLDNAPRWW